MGRAIEEVMMFMSALTKEEIDERLCARCGAFDLCHNDGYRKDPDVTKKVCKKFVKKEVKQPGKKKKK